MAIICIPFSANKSPCYIFFRNKKNRYFYRINASKTLPGFFDKKSPRIPYIYKRLD